MPEFRQDLISGQWVIMAADRAKRPETFVCKGDHELDCTELPERVESCPFCPGNEALTPPEVFSISEPVAGAGNQRWLVRVVPNKYPAVEPAVEPVPGSCRDELLFKEMPGYGVHEVLIETPLHNCHPATLGPRQMELVVESYRQRCSSLAANRRLRFVQIFRNHGRKAGASIAHPHSQLIALPFIPAAVKDEIDGAYRYYLNHERCPYCHLLAEELACGERVIAENASCVAYLPYASRFPFESWIVPRRHQSSFVELTGREASDLAAIICTVLGSLSRSLDGPPYNYYLHNSPLRMTGLAHYHWHLEIIPKLSMPAGFEIGTGVFINVTLPEEAAHFIREKGGEGVGATEKNLFHIGSA